MLSAQTSSAYTLMFRPVFGNSTLVMNDSLYNSGSDSIRFETLKFYISGIELTDQDKLTWKEEKSFHLIDASDEKSLRISLSNVPAHSFNKIKFNLGIDSTTNVSGAMGGDLDPVKGMYWTWQSGYINFKLEGKSNVCKSGNHEFQFHLGGYQFPFNSLQTITLVLPMDKQSTVVIDMEKIINAIDFENGSHIMSPGNDAMLLSQKISRIFSVSEQ
jgi:hypothetical protein